MEINKSRLLRLEGIFALLALALALSGLLTAQDASDIEAGEIVAGALTDDQLSARYVFAGTAGDQVGATLTSHAFDAFLRLEAPDGAEIASNDDTDGSLNSAISGVILPEDGDYTLVVESANGEGTGAYELTLNYFSVRTIAYGDVIEGELSSDVSSDVYQFEGQEDDVIGIRMASSDFDAYVALTDSDLTELASDDDSGGERNALLAGYMLPETGTYLITARSYQPTAEGAYTLALETVDLTPLDYNSRIDGEMTGGALYYTIDGHAGDIIHARLNSEGTLDTIFSLRSPLGYIAQWDDDSGDLLDPEFRNILLDFDGVYTLVVQPVGEDVRGTFTLTLDAQEPEPVECGAPHELRFGSKNQQTAFRFDAENGASYRVTLSYLDGVDVSSASMRIWVNGNEVASAYGDVAASDVGTEFTAITDGEARVLVSDYFYRNRTYTFTVDCL
jgi:hypothetical protein